MTIGSLALFGLLVGSTVDLVHYAPAQAPIARTTLLVSARGNSVTILNENNLAVSFKPPQYPDLLISDTFHVVCVFPFNPGPYTVRVWADSKYNLIPTAVVEYKQYDPSYIELEIDPSFFADGIDAPDLKDHKLHIDFLPSRAWAPSPAQW